MAGHGRGLIGLGRAARLARRVGGWPARRVALAALAASLLLSAAWLGHVAPLQAQEGETAAPEATGASGVTIRLDDLVDLITYAFVDRFDVQLAKLDAATTYEVVVSSSHAAALGIGGCGEATQTATVTGATSRTVEFRVYACGLGAGTVTAALRAAGASRAAVTVSQGVTVEPIPDWVPADERPVRGAAGAVAQVGTPGFVKNPRFEQVMTTSVVAKWDTPTADGGKKLSGYGLLFWHEDEEHPSYRDDVLVKGLTPREHTYTGLQHDATYKFRIHACNETPACGWWTTPPLEVTTQRAPTPQRPHTIGFSQLTATSVVVTWSAAANTGGVPLTGFDLRYWPYDSEIPDQETGATTHPADGGTDRGETLRGLAASTVYEVKMRACNGPKDRHCSSWSADHRFTTLAGTTPTPTPTPSPSTTVPQNLDVAPLTGRRAELTWDRVDSADAYDVQAKVFGGTSWGSVICAASGSTRSGGRVSEPRCLINLVSIPSVKSGLGKHGAFALRVRSVTGGSPSDFSEPVVIMDTPIVAASGASPSTGGRATLTWNPVQRTLGDSFPTGGTYAFRYRKVVNDAGTEHTESTWEPNAYIPVATTTTNPYTGLTLYAVYGIQLIYTPPQQGNQPAGPRVFAARDVYVWPSDEAAGSGDRAGGRVATYPLNFPLDNANYAPRATYVYRLCDDTLPELNLHGPDGKRDPWRVEWSSFIFNAFDQWRLATNELVFVNQEHQPCAEYSALVAQTVQAVQAALGDGVASAEDAKNLESHVRGLLERSRHVGVLRDAVLRAAIAAGDEVANEVFMYASNDLPMVFGFGAALEPGFCGANAAGCAFRRGVRDDTKGWITDIALKKQGHFEPDESAFIPEIPEVRFDTCQPRLSNNQTHDTRFAKVYSTLVHEVGHALGIREGSDGAGDHPDRGLQSDSAMAAHLGELCSPTPFDVMAVQALNQHRDSPAP